MKTIAYVENFVSGEIQLFIGGKMLNVLPSNEGYTKVKSILDQIGEDGTTDEDVIAAAEKEIEETLSKKKVIEGVTAPNGDKLEVRDNTVYFIRSSPKAEYELSGVLQDRLLKILKEKKSVMMIVRFLSNMYANPSYRAVRELYGFLAANDLPFTPDGCFLAYKKVRYDYKDIHSGNFDNSIGQTPEMPRNMVDDNSDSTCSSGLHICSKSYLPHYGCSDSKVNRVIVCKVNPADVVSVPRDYNNAKMRACKYEVIDELPTFETALSSYVYGKHQPNFIKTCFDKLVAFYTDFYKLTPTELQKHDITGSLSFRMEDETPAVIKAFVSQFSSTFGIDAALVEEKRNKVMYNLSDALTLLSENDDQFVMGDVVTEDATSPVITADSAMASASK